MAKTCSICDEEILEENGKLKGTMLKIIEDKKKSWVYVCNTCMKKEPEKYIEKAKIMSA